MYVYNKYLIFICGWIRSDYVVKKAHASILFNAYIKTYKTFKVFMEYIQQLFNMDWCYLLAMCNGHIEVDLA